MRRTLLLGTLLIFLALALAPLAANETDYAATPTPTPTPCPVATPAPEGETLTLTGRENTAYRLGFLSAIIEAKTAELAQLQQARDGLLKELKTISPTPAK